MIKEYFQDGKQHGVEISYLEETKQLGTVGSLSLLTKIPSNPIIVMNGDILTNIDFKSLIDFHIQRKATATMCVREYDIQVPYGVVNVSDDKVVHIEEKPIHSLATHDGRDQTCCALRQIGILVKWLISVVFCSPTMCSIKGSYLHELGSLKVPLRSPRPPPRPSS